MMNGSTRFSDLGLGWNLFHNGHYNLVSSHEWEKYWVACCCCYSLFTARIVFGQIQAICIGLTLPMSSYWYNEWFHKVMIGNGQVRYNYHHNTLTFKSQMVTILGPADLSTFHTKMKCVWIDSGNNSHQLDPFSVSSLV